MTKDNACCADAEWTRVADLGNAQAIDCALVRCSACGRSWMHLWTPYAAKESYSPLDDAAAAELAAMPPGPERKRKLCELLGL